MLPTQQPTERTISPHPACIVKDTPHSLRFRCPSRETCLCTTLASPPPPPLVLPLPCRNHHTPLPHPEGGGEGGSAAPDEDSHASSPSSGERDTRRTATRGSLSRSPSPTGPGCRRRPWLVPPPPNPDCSTEPSPQAAWNITYRHATRLHDAPCLLEKIICILFRLPTHAAYSYSKRLLEYPPCPMPTPRQILLAASSPCSRLNEPPKKDKPRRHS